jgi:hypothetical protein
MEMQHARSALRVHARERTRERWEQLAKSIAPSLRHSETAMNHCGIAYTSSFLINVCAKKRGFFGSRAPCHLNPAALSNITLQNKLLGQLIFV